MKDTASALRIDETVPQLTPPLKWAGGKRWILPTLRPLYERAARPRLVEPFAGGLAVALGLLPERAYLTDVNPHAINFYRQLQQGLDIEIQMENEAGCFYQHRERFNFLVKSGAADGPEAAALFYFLNRTCFNGLCRFNGSGLFNVPFGKYKRINYQRDFSAYRAVLARWEFRACDFSKVALEPTDFLYADPPYDVEFTHYAKEDFRWTDQIRLAVWLGRHPGPVVASNQATARILDLYRSLGFDITPLSAPRMISCDGDRTRAVEILATRNIP